MDYTLRPATRDDYNFLYNLHRTTIRAAVEATWGWNELFQQNRFRARFNPAASQIVVVDGQDVGVLQIEERETEIFLGLIEIATTTQGQGLGGQIVRDLLKMAGAHQLPVTLHVLKANRRARRLYERLGFLIIEEREERFVMRALPAGSSEQ